MWLLNTGTYELREFTKIDRYAILSHVWGEEEVSFEEMLSQTEKVKSKAGYMKVVAFCDKAHDQGLSWAWADTACIDKRSSAELNENINRMYDYYSSSATCIIFLKDVEEPTSVAQFKASWWFTRGWTLQELLATRHRLFYTSKWEEISESTLNRNVHDLCSETTGIDINVIRAESSIFDCCVAEKMSWAAHRKTTRPEDLAYCLLGIFHVHLNIVYGEGSGRAFARLQSEIMDKHPFDQSLFAWRSTGRFEGLLAQSPEDFKNSPAFSIRHIGNILAPSAKTNIGVTIRPQVYLERSDEGDLDDAREIQAALHLYVKTESGWMIPTIRLRRVGHMHCWVNGRQLTVWCRIDCEDFGLVWRGSVRSQRTEEILVLEYSVGLAIGVSAGDRLREREDNWGTDPRARVPPAWEWQRDVGPEQGQEH